MRGVRGGILVGLLSAIVAAPAMATATMPGQLLTFGDNYDGQLGRPADKSTPNPIPTVVRLPAGSGRVVLAAAGDSHSLVVTSSGRLYAFGDTNYGALGNTVDDTIDVPHPQPVLVVLPGMHGHIVQIAAGFYDSLVLTSAGQIYGFGINGQGELGNGPNAGTPNPNPTPRLITLFGASGRPIQIADGYEDSFAVTSTGELYAWGEGNFGQLGTGSTTYVNPTPARVLIAGSATGVASVAAGGSHTLVVMSSGALYGFGNNLYGQLGSTKNRGTNTPNPVPTRISLPPGSGRVVQVSASDDSLVLTSTGAVYAFGANRYGQLCSGVNLGQLYGVNPTPRRVALKQLKGRVKEIVASQDDSMFLSTTGQLLGCGDDGVGELGLPVPSSGSYPTPVAARVGVGTTIEAVAVGPRALHTLAIVADLAITTRSLRSGTKGHRYKLTLHASGGAPPYYWFATGLPKGLTIGAHTGKLHGVPATAGHYAITVSVIDNGVIVFTRHLRLVIKR